jgi:peroxiredoxin
MNIKDTLIIVIPITLLLLLGILWLAPDSFSSKAPNVRISSLDGKVFALNELQGKPVLVTFWATTCPGCIKEQPHLVDLHHKYSDQGLTIIGVAMAYDPLDQVRALIDQRQIPYVITHDTDGQIAQNFGNVKLTPTSFVIAPDGTIRFKKTGELNMPIIEQEISQMLSAKG